MQAVYYQSGAEKAGILNCDVITSIDGIPVKTRKDVIDRINQSDESILELSINRGGVEKTIIVQR